MEWFDYGTCFCLCGRWNSHWVNCFISFYFILSSEMLNRTSSHMWGRWYLPMFLFRDALLTLMYTASLISLMKFSSVVIWPVVLKWSYIGERGLQVFFEPLSKCSWRLSYVFLITFHPVTFESVYDSTFLCYMIFVFVCHQEVFDAPASFKVYLYCIVSCIHFLYFH